MMSEALPEEATSSDMVRDLVREASGHALGTSLAVRAWMHWVKEI